MDAGQHGLPGIHARLKRRRLLPATHLVDGGYTSVALFDTAARTHRIRVVGPLPPSPAWRRQAPGFTREDFTIDFDRRTITCPKGKISGNWLELPAMAPYTVVRFNPAHCDPCPVRTSCTSGKAPRTVNFLPRHLHDL
ncbi:transposase [Streptomyces sp. NPDC002896]|uniref:transposase n=1 Tax=Streptomyces sp. NPDC002896 TaxID=3154438 RepID=UPI0033340528